MNQKQAWHKPQLHLLDARATAQPVSYAMHFDPNNNGDILRDALSISYVLCAPVRLLYVRVYFGPLATRFALGPRAHNETASPVPVRGTVAVPAMTQLP